MSGTKLEDSKSRPGAHLLMFDHRCGCPTWGLAGTISQNNPQRVLRFQGQEFKEKENQEKSHCHFWSSLRSHATSLLHYISQISHRSPPRFEGREHRSPLSVETHQHYAVIRVYRWCVLYMCLYFPKVATHTHPLPQVLEETKYCADGILNLKTFPNN